MACGRPETKVEEHLREADGLPNKRDTLAPGTLPGRGPNPEGDENRAPSIPASRARERASDSIEQRRGDR